MKSSHGRLRCPTRGSSWARVAATGRVAAPRPPGVRVALTIGHGRLGLWRAAARRTVRSVQRGAVSALAPAPRARRGILACAGGTHAPRAPPAPSRRAHRARARARVRLEGFGCAARPAAVRRDPRAGRSTCAPGHGEGLYVLLRPAQSRPARSARAWWACSGLPLGPRGWYPADSSAPTRCCGRRGPPACLGGSPACVGHLGRVPGGLEGENPISEAATGPSATGSGVWRGGAPFWALTARYVAS